MEETYGYTMEELFPLMQELTEKYTSKESTSVSYEAAEQLMQAILYCIGETMQHPGAEQLAGGERLPARAAYERGYARTLLKVQRTRKAYNQLVKMFDCYGNKACQETVQKGFPEFFRWYDARFCPQDHLLTLDYPVLAGLESLSGIDRIEAYLKCITLEQQFLAKLPRRYVVEWNISHCGEYEEYFVNICRVPLRRILCCMLGDLVMEQEKLSSEDYRKLAEELAVYHGGEGVDRLEQKLFVLLRAFLGNIYRNEGELLEYLRRDLRDFAFELVEKQGGKS